MACSLKFKDSKSNTKEVMMSNGAIDPYYNILNLGVFRSYNTNLSRLASEKYGTDGRLYVEDGNKALPNTPLFDKIDAERKRLGIYETKAKLEVKSVTPEYKNGSAKDLVEQINEASRYFPLANRLKSLIGDVKVRWITPDSKEYSDNKKSIGHEFTGLYVPNSDAIYLVSGMVVDYEKTLLHEVLHHLTYNEIRKNPEQITSIYQRVLAELEQNDLDTSRYSLSNLDEFMVGIFTDPKLISDIQSLPGGKSSTLWKDFLDFFKSLIGIEKNETLLNEILDDVVSYIGDRSKEYFTFEGLVEPMASIESGNLIKEGVNTIFEQNPELSNIGTPEQYSQYLDQIFPDSKVKDIVYHFSNVKIDKPDKEKFSLSANINRRKGFFGISKNINPGNNFANVEGTIPHAMLFDMKNPDFGDFSIIPPIVAKDDSKDSAIIKQRGDIDYYSVFEPEQIHILGSKKDVDGFKDWIKNNQESLTITSPGLPTITLTQDQVDMTC